MDQRVIDQIRSGEHFGPEISDAEIANTYADTLYAASINLAIAMEPIKAGIYGHFKPLAELLSARNKR